MTPRPDLLVDELTNNLLAGLSLEAMDELFGVTEADAKVPLATNAGMEKHQDVPAVTEVPMVSKKDQVV